MIRILKIHRGHLFQKPRHGILRRPAKALNKFFDQQFGIVQLVADDCGGFFKHDGGYFLASGSAPHFLETRIHDQNEGDLAEMGGKPMVDTCHVKPDRHHSWQF